MFRSELLSKPKLHQEHSSGADTIHFVFLDISESLDWSTMSSYCSSFVTNYLKLYSLCRLYFFFYKSQSTCHTHFLEVSFVHKRFPMTAVF